MKTLTKKEKRALDEFGLRLAKKLKVPFEMYLYGSKARGDAHRYSDIDVLVITLSDSPNNETMVLDIAYDIILDFGVDLSVTVYPKSLWEIYKKMPTSFSFSVTKEAIKL